MDKRNKCWEKYLTEEEITNKKYFKKRVSIYEKEKKQKEKIRAKLNRAFCARYILLLIYEYILILTVTNGTSGGT